MSNKTDHTAFVRLFSNIKHLQCMFGHGTNFQRKRVVRVGQED